MQNQRLLVQF